MNILITGGAGFIGSHLTKYLVKRGDDVTVIDNLLRGNKIDKLILNNINFINGDVRDKDIVSKLCKNCDQIYHLAAVLGVDAVAKRPLKTMEVESEGIKNIIRGSLYSNIQNIIYSSTSGVYGKKIMDQAVTEELEVSPRSCYSIAKRYCEIYLASAYKDKGIKSVSARSLSNLYRSLSKNACTRSTKESVS